jgi:O-methyltransferase involved in polyketide biosynthesis
MRLRLKVLAGLLALKGEPWKTFFDPDSLSNQLKSLGFKDTKSLDQEAINARFFNGRKDRLSVRGPGHVMLARI